MRTNRFALIFVVPFLVFLFSGCASKAGLITTLEDLTTESSKEGYIKVPQYRVMSVPGFLPFVDAGGLYFYKRARKPSSAIGCSDNNKSFVLESKIENNCGKDCLNEIMKELVTLKMNAEEIIINKIKLTTAQSNYSRPENNTAVSEAKSDYTNSVNKFNDNYDKILDKIKHNGILIYRWNATSSKDGDLKLGDMFNTSGDREDKYSGIAVVSGLRMATLYVGKDILECEEKLNLKSRYANRFELTTHVMQGKYINYIAEYDLAAMAKAKLKASYAQLKDIPAAIKKLDEIEIGATLSKVANLSNMGVVGEMKRTRREVDWGEPTGIKEADLMGLDGYETFYSVQSDFSDVIDMLR